MSAIIRREAFAACAEGQALPGGEYVVALNEPAVLTDARRIPCPEPLRFPVMTVGTGRGRCIAGQSQVSLATWEYVEAEDRWFDRGPNAGERPVLFLPDGTLVIERGGPDHPTEGWAGTSLDGQPVRIVRADHARDLYEVTEIGPFAVGQLPDGGIGLLFDGKRYLVESGDVHTPWFVLGANGVLAIAARKLAQNETVLLWVDANRVAELPAAPTTPPVIVVPPIIVIPPKEPVVEVPNLFEIVERVASRVPLNGPADCGPFTEACAIECHRADARFGHLKKNPGQNQFNGHAVDALLFKDTGQAVDIIVGSKTATPKPGWGVDIPRYSASDWIAPAGAVDPPKEPDEPKPDTALAARVAKLEKAHLELVEAINHDSLTISGLQDQIEALTKRVDELPKGGAVDLTPYAQHGGRVTLKVKLPWVGEQTLHGTID